MVSTSHFLARISRYGIFYMFRARRKLRASSAVPVMTDEANALAVKVKLPDYGLW